MNRQIRCPICGCTGNPGNIEECLSSHAYEDKCSGYIKAGDRVEALDIDYYEYDEGTTEQAIYRRHFMIWGGKVVDILGKYQRTFVIQKDGGETDTVKWNEFYDDIPYSYARWTALDAEPEIQFSQERLRKCGGGLQITDA